MTQTWSSGHVMLIRWFIWSTCMQRDDICLSELDPWKNKEKETHANRGIEYAMMCILGWATRNNHKCMQTSPAFRVQMLNLAIYLRFGHGRHLAQPLAISLIGCVKSIIVEKYGERAAGDKTSIIDMHNLRGPCIFFDLIGLKTNIITNMRILFPYIYLLGCIFPPLQHNEIQNNTACNDPRAMTTWTCISLMYTRCPYKYYQYVACCYTLHTNSYVPFFRTISIHL